MRCTSSVNTADVSARGWGGPNQYPKTPPVGGGRIVWAAGRKSGVAAIWSTVVGEADRAAAEASEQQQQQQQPGQPGQPGQGGESGGDSGQQASAKLRRKGVKSRQGKKSMRGVNEWA